VKVSSLECVVGEFDDESPCVDELSRQTRALAVLCMRVVSLLVNPHVDGN
jgi:hypothetical protein